ncbi:hypothetical protein MBLNU230_g2665t1 [Neophaeotheca triangularis]
MADIKKTTDGPSTDSPEAWDYRTLPDWDEDFVNEDDFRTFASALSAPDISPSEEDLLNPKRQSPEFITALNDWRPIHQNVRGKRKGEVAAKGKKGKKPRRGKDETREGWSYSLFRYPILVFVLGCVIVEGAIYLLVRMYIYLYEHYITWRGRRNRLRKNLSTQTSYQDWVEGAKELDQHLGNDRWKDEDEYAYYNDKTVRKARDQMRQLRKAAEKEEASNDSPFAQRAIDDLRSLAEACAKNNFAGYENPRLYSETYYGTKELVQSFVDEVATTLRFLLASKQLNQQDKRNLSKHVSNNFGRSALCLSGGATFAYYHFGTAKALLDADLLPSIITGTSGGALVAALLATRTNEELKRLLIPALTYRIKACQDSFFTWAPRWWRTGARFDSVEWAKKCAWFSHGSLTFLEAYQRTGKILNVSCVPSDPHSPTILANYRTAPDCVIWSAVLASAAVPGILNPVTLMRKNRNGQLEPYSFGHKWKDGSLRTDIPLKSLNTHFNVNFSIVSQVNPHVNLFFFSSRGSVGRPVTHRRGRGWRGGYLGSALEQFLKLDLNKWLKVLRHLELLPRWLGQDWSQIWLQGFSGSITLWPKTQISDFYYILSDPTPPRLARMLHMGQLAAWPKLKFIANRMAIEKVIENAREATRPPEQPFPTPGGLPRDSRLHGSSKFSEEDLHALLEKARHNGGSVALANDALTPTAETTPARLPPSSSLPTSGRASPSLPKRSWSNWFPSRSSSPTATFDNLRPSLMERRSNGSGASGGGGGGRGLLEAHRRGSAMDELKRQSLVFWDDEPVQEGEEAEGSEVGDTGTEGEGDGEREKDGEKDVAPYDSESESEDGAESVTSANSGVEIRGKRGKGE